MKKRKIPLTPILLGALCLILLAVFGMIRLIQKEEDDNMITTVDPASVRELIDTLPTEKVSKITIDENSQTVRLALSSGKWILSNDSETPIRQSMVKSLLSEVQTLLALREIGQGELSEYGLEHPKAALTLDCGETVFRLCFGDYNKTYDGYYFRIDGSDTVYIVENDLFLAAVPEFDDLLTLPELPDRSDLETVMLTYPNGQTLPISKDSADSGQTQLLACLAELEISYRVDYGHDSDQIYGLDAPLTVELALQSGERLVLHFGRGESDAYTYLRIGQSAAVYVISAEHPDVLLSYLDEMAENS